MGAPRRSNPLADILDDAFEEPAERSQELILLDPKADDEMESVPSDSAQVRSPPRPPVK